MNEEATLDDTTMSGISMEDVEDVSAESIDPLNEPREASYDRKLLPGVPTRVFSDCPTATGKREQDS